MTDQGDDIFTLRTVPGEAAKDKAWYRIENATVHSDGGDTTKIFIYDQIGSFYGTSSDEFVEQLMAVGTPKIELHLNSPGGAVFHGVAIYNALKSHPAEVSVYVDALAASAASFIAQAAAPGKLFMAKGSTMMIHDGIAAVYGNQADMLHAADILDKLSNNIASFYADRAGGSVNDWRDLMKAETWYTAQEAVDAKLADSVAGTVPDGEEDPEDKWDLGNVFKFPSRSKAPSPLEVAAMVRSANQGGTVTAPAAPASTQTPAAPAPPAVPTPPAPAAPAAPTATAPASVTEVQFKIGGLDTTDHRAVQAHIDALETFQNETVEAGRKAFVASLASGQHPKVLATQIEQLEKFALGLTAEQFRDWQASWEAVPANSTLSPAPITDPAGGTGQNNNGGTQRDAVKDRIAVLEGIVAQHQLSNMNQETLEKTGSWQELQRLKAQQAQQQ